MLVALPDALRLAVNLSTGEYLIHLRKYIPVLVHLCAYLRFTSFFLFRAPPNVKKGHRVPVALRSANLGARQGPLH